jgi:membrane associated rhomboid family serine protease
MSPARWTDSLEDLLGRWSVPYLTRGLVALNAGAWLLNLASPGFTSILKLDPSLVAQGEYWRLITFLFVPSNSAHPIFLLLFLWFLWSIGDALEAAWGSFHLNLFFFIGIVAVVSVSFLQPSIPINPFYLHNSLFLAFATTMPDQKVFFFPLPIPLSVRWVAAVTSGLLFLPAFFQPILFPSIFAGLAGYIAFFSPPFLESLWERFRNRGS